MVTEQSMPGPLPTVIVLPPEVDAVNASEVAEELDRAIDQGVPVVIADMTATGFCDSSGVRVLVQAQKRAAAAGVRFRVVVTATVIRRVLSITGADQVLSLYSSLVSAMADRPVGSR